MPKVSPIQTNFNGGEYSELAHGRIDSDRYKIGLEVCENYLPTLQGPVIRRPGLAFAAESKSFIFTPRLIPFEYSTIQAYQIEMGPYYFRFFKDHALITNPAVSITNISVGVGGRVQVTAPGHGFSDGDSVVISGVLGTTQINNREYIVAFASANDFVIKDIQGIANVDGSTWDSYTSGGTVAKPYEIAHTYAGDQLFQVKHTQSNDVLYLTHPSHPPRKLTRSGHTSWTLTAISFSDGPYLSIPVAGNATLTPGAATGTGVTLNASSTIGINNDTGFQATDVGRFIRLREGGTWGWAKIASYVSSTQVTIDIQSTLTNTNAKSVWRLGSWSSTSGYPAAVVFHEDRLFFIKDLRVDGSNTGDYENFAPSDMSGTVVASNAVSYPLNSSKANVGRWLTADEKGLLAGTSGGEWIIKPASSQEGLSPTNVSAKEATTYGSADIQPVQSGKSTIFVQGTRNRFRDMSYFYDVDGFRATDLNLLNDEICGTGIVQLAYSKLPQSIVWAVREDGMLLAMTYERDIDSFKAGWARCPIGGKGDAYGRSAKVKSVSVIPSPDGTRAEVWVVVERYIGGITRKYIEYMTEYFKPGKSLHEAFFVDCGTSYDPSQLGYIGEIPAGTVSVTIANHGLSTGDKVFVHGVTEGRFSGLENNTYRVTVVDSNTFTLDNPPDLPGASLPVYLTLGYFAKFVSQISGLNWLEGETVAVFGNGADLGDEVVTNGKVLLSSPAAIVQLGYAYASKGKTLRIDAGSADGTAIGKTRRTHRVGFMLSRTLGFKYGPSFDELDEYIFRRSSDSTDSPVPLFSGIISENIEAGYDYDNKTCWCQDRPFPGIVLAYFPHMVTQDRG